MNMFRIIIQIFECFCFTTYYAIEGKGEKLTLPSAKIASPPTPIVAFGVVAKRHAPSDNGCCLSSDRYAAMSQLCNCWCFLLAATTVLVPTSQELRTYHRIIAVFVISLLTVRAIKPHRLAQHLL